jgi:hypothetical protein
LGKVWVPMELSIGKTMGLDALGWIYWEESTGLGALGWIYWGESTGLGALGWIYWGEPMGLGAMGLPCCDFFV